jgi:Ca2+-binding RTX toxin-like protein
MASFTGTSGNDTVTPAEPSEGVLADPEGSRPAEAADTLFGDLGDHLRDGGGGNESIFGSEGRNRSPGRTGDDTVSGGSGGALTHTGGLLPGDIAGDGVEDVAPEIAGEGATPPHAGDLILRAQRSGARQP